MPTSYRIDRDRGIIFSRGYGVLTDEDLRQHLESAQADPDFHADLDQLYDFSEVEEVRVTAEYVRELGRQAVYGPRSRRAFVTPEDHQFGMARMFQISVDERSGHVVLFRDLAEARAWLGLEEKPGGDE